MCEGKARSRACSSTSAGIVGCRRCRRQWGPASSVACRCVGLMKQKRRRGWVEGKQEPRVEQWIERWADVQVRRRRRRRRL